MERTQMKKTLAILQLILVSPVCCVEDIKTGKIRRRSNSLARLLLLLFKVLMTFGPARSAI
jgi:hypothetical protein